MPPYCRLCDVTKPKLNMQNQILRVFKNNFATDFFINLQILVTSNHFPQINQLFENNYLYETNFDFYETSLNIQNGGTHTTSGKILNCL